MDDILAETHDAREAVFSDLSADRHHQHLKAWSRKHEIMVQLAFHEAEIERLAAELEEAKREFARVEAAEEEFKRMVVVEETRAAWAFTIREARRPLTVGEFMKMLNARWG